MTADIWPWAALFLLGAVHGVNPGMGWLFAVALGLQEQRGRAVWRALLPLAAGHALAIAAVLLLAGAAGLVAAPAQLKWVVATVLLAFGLYRLVRQSHPRYGGMRVGPRDLTIWSFLMATAHGAGLMALPFALGLARSGQGGHAGHAPVALAGLPGAESVALGATVVHTAGYLVVLGLVAAVVYHKLGLRFLRSAWFNLDLVWAGALIATALVTPFL